MEAGTTVGRPSPKAAGGLYYMWAMERIAVLYDVAAAMHFARLGRLGSFVKAKGAAIAGLSKVISKRGHIQKMRTTDVADIEPHLERSWLTTKIREKKFDTTLAEGRR